MRRDVPATKSGPTGPGQRAFTLAELMVAMSVFALVVVGAIYSQLLGMRLFNVTATKLTASQDARDVLDQVRDEIRSGKLLYVGNGNGTGFTNVAANKPQQGNALQIYGTTDTNTYVRYYLDAVPQQLKRQASGSSHIDVIASYVTNQIVFHAEDYAGNVLTNDQNNRVIRMTLEFYQWEYPVVQAPAGAYYDYYRLQTRVTRRAID